MRAPSPLSALARGERAGLDAVLQNCGFEGLGVTAFGREQVTALFRRAPLALDELQEVAGERFAAVAGRDSDGRLAGLAADLNDGWILRLWRLGGTRLDEPIRPAVSVPADLDLDQRGGRLAFDPADHSELDRAAAKRVRALGEAWLGDQTPEVVAPLRRARPIVLRAMSTDGRAAALYRIEGAAERGMAGFFALALFDDRETIVVDDAGRGAALEAVWAPQLRTDP